jgi:hypothetical protein
MTDATLDNLTCDAVLAEPAGPRLDAWVAELSGCWKCRCDPAFTYADGSVVKCAACAGLRPPSFSADWADAGPLLEELFRLKTWGLDREGDSDSWRILGDGCEYKDGYKLPRAEATGDTAPLAIARAYVIARRGL